MIENPNICKMRIVEWPQDNYVGQLSPVGERLKCFVHRNVVEPKTGLREGFKSESSMVMPETFEVYYSLRIFILTFMLGTAYYFCIFHGPVPSLRAASIPGCKCFETCMLWGDHIEG